MKTLKQRALRPGAFAVIAAIVVFGFCFIGCGGDDDISVRSVELNVTTLTLGINETASLTATVKPGNASTKGVTWLSSNTDVATVAVSAGIATVTGVAEGTATIIVSTKDGGKIVTCEVSVGTSVTGVLLSMNTYTLAVEGATGSLVATVQPANATNKTVTWESSDTSVVTVTADATTGVATITAVAVPEGADTGTATITVTTEDGAYTKTCAVTVLPKVPVTGVTLSNNTLDLVQGYTGTLSATVVPTEATNPKVTWSTSAPGVVTVTVNPIGGEATITAVGVPGGGESGTATITVTSNDDSTKTDTCTVTVTSQVNEIKGKSLYIGENTLIVFDDDLTFVLSTWAPDMETWIGGEYEPSSKGSYTYNSVEQTFALHVNEFWGVLDDEVVSRWVTKDEAPDNPRFVPRIYKYEFTTLGSMLAQRILINQGADELWGRTYTLPNSTACAFALSGNTYSFTRTGRTTIGTYYYDSTTTPKTVYLRPTSINGQTLAEYCDALDENDYWEDHPTEPADIRASQTNELQGSGRYTYNTSTRTLANLMEGF